MKKAIIYTRTSPDLISVRTQIVVCKLFAKLNGVDILRICHDPDENDRKVLLDLLRDSKTAKWDCLLILDPSVLSDDICTFLKYREKFNLSGKRIFPVVNYKELTIEKSSKKRERIIKIFGEKKSTTKKRHKPLTD